MKSKSKLLKLTVFSIIIALMFFVSPNLISATVNIPIYIQTSSGIERVSYNSLIDAFTNYNFEINKTQQYIPDDKCSLRATGGILDMNGLTFSNSHLNFYTPQGSIPGQGSLTAQNGRIRLSIEFKVFNVLENDQEKIISQATGTGALNNEKINFSKIIILYDKSTKTVNIEGIGNINFTAEYIPVTFTQWCSGTSTEYYLITLENKLNQSRSSDQVNALINQHPEIFDRYESSGNPPGGGSPDENPIPIVPEFGVYVGILTLICAVGLFFIIRRK